MSGFEVVGVVLGVLPLVISALEHYEDGIAVFRRYYCYRQEIRKVVLILCTEQAELKNTCEQLLIDIVPAHQIVQLLGDSRNKLWEHPQTVRRLKARLRDSYDVYMERLQAMSMALEKLKSRLDLNESWQVRTGTKGFRRAFRAGKFSLMKASYDEQLAQIKECNSALRNLTIQSLELRHSRRSRSIHRYFQTLRDCARSAYKSLSSSFSCGCPRRHNLHWQIGPQQGHESVHDVETLSGQIRFRSVILQCCPESPEMKITLLHELEIWPIVETGPIPQSFQPKELPKSVPIKSKVRFTEVYKPDTTVGLKGFATNASGTHTTTMRQLDQPRSTLSIGTCSTSNFDEGRSTIEYRITDFCRRLSIESDRVSKCLGFISDGSRRFSVYPSAVSSGHSDACSRFSLDEALSKSRGDLPLMTRADRLRLASIIATAVLHFHHTPLLESKWTRNDILFIQRGSTKGYQQVYVSKLLPDNDPQSRKATAHVSPFILNPTLFALGILLIELCLDQPFDSLRSPGHLHSGNPMLDDLVDYETAIRLLDTDRIREEAGPLYESAVRRCIRCTFDVRSTDLEEKEFLEAVYDGVVSSLKDVEKAFFMNNR